MSDYTFSDDKEKMQIDVIHAMLTNSYWSKDISKEIVAKAVQNSLCYGVYKNDVQVGFARIITDEATFAYLCDVIIDEKHQHRGIGVALMKYIMQDSRLQGLRRFCLATRDAHRLYERFGFKVTSSPQTWMEIKDNDIYTRMRKQQG